MIELDGVEYTVKTPEENTQDLVDYVNNYCIDKGVVNSLGETIFIEVNITNPIYLLFWAVGYMTTFIQKLLYSIGKQYSIPAASEKQLLNIANNAKVSRLLATETTIRCLVTAKDTGTCEITTSLGSTISYLGKNYRFHPVFAISIAADESAVIVLISDLLVSLNIQAGAVTEFDTEVINLESIVSDTSLPGRAIESIPALRRRLLSRQVALSGIDRAVQAIRALPGITACNIFYNTNATASVTIGGLVIPARHTALYVQGYNADVAKTYFSFIDRPCVNTAGTITQQYVLLNGQVFNAYLIPPVARNAFIKVYTSEEVSDATKTSIRAAISSISIDLDVGSRLTMAQVMEKMSPSFNVIGTEICLTVDGDYTYAASPEPNEILVILNANILIEVAA